MPTYLRRFYLKRLSKQYDDENKELKKEQKKLNNRRS